MVSQLHQGPPVRSVNEPVEDHPIRIENSYMDIRVTEPFGRLETYSFAEVVYKDVTWSTDRDTRALYIYDRAGRRIVQYNTDGWLKVAVV
jgi:hypothetical protein